MPTQIASSHRIRIELPINQCQKLFTPAGEAHWVEGWSPTYLYPSDGATTAGMVFATGEGDERTLWMLVDYTQHPHRARYARTTPASRIGTVDVFCEAADAHSTEVTVTYAMTALTPEGETILGDFTEAPYRKMIEHWKERIDGRLAQLRTIDIP
jgi:hypothetical protein